MRHGDAQSGLLDEIRPLSPQGMTEARQAGIFLKKSGETPDTVYHSTLLRARQTAEIAAREIDPEMRLYECKGLCPHDSVTAFASDFSGGLDRNIMVVGHQPFISALASFLLSKSITALTIQFTTGTITCLERDETFDGGWTLRLHVTAKTIHKMIQI